MKNLIFKNALTRQLQNKVKIQENFKKSCESDISF